MGLIGPISWDSMSPSSQAGFRDGPEKMLVSTATRTGFSGSTSPAMACAVDSARSAIPARPVTASGSPSPGASRVSPPATRTTSLGLWPATAVVARRWSGPVWASSEKWVRIFWLDAGTSASASPSENRTSCEPGSMTMTPADPAVESSIAARIPSSVCCDR